MIFISVDLPAPFSPSTAWISPGATRRSTRSLALTAGYCLLMPRSSSRRGVFISRMMARIVPPRNHRATQVSPPRPRGRSRWRAAKKGGLGRPSIRRSRGSMPADVDELEEEQAADDPDHRMHLARLAGEQLEHPVGDEAEGQAVGDRVGERHDQRGDRAGDDLG